MLSKFLVTLCLLLSCNLAFAAKLQVAASIYPMAEFCRAVGGDLVEVFQLVPDGTEPHDYEPSPKDLTKVGQAKVLVYNGVVDDWAKNALTALSDRQLAGVETGAGLMELKGVQDPHVWISPKLAMVQAKRICEAFCQADTVNAAKYHVNLDNYVLQLQELDKEYQKFALGKRRGFATAHAAFGHLAKDYNLEMLAVTGLSPEAEPTPADLQKVINLVKQYGVRYVFFETLTSPKLAELVAQETGAKTAVLDPVEGVSQGSKATYLDLQKENLLALQKEFAE